MAYDDHMCMNRAKISVLFSSDYLTLNVALSMEDKFEFAH